MKTRFAFVGFRHPHIFDVLSAVRDRPDCQIVACCEEDAATRQALRETDRVDLTHEDYAEMLRDVECDVIAIGDYYGRRGALALAALRAGRHVLSDKPLCTSLSDQAQIEDISSKRCLSVGLQLDCRGAGPFIRLRDIIRSGDLGKVCTIHIGAQHPLLAASRPPWYFEPGKHGGTINDIGIHVFDLVPWLTGIPWEEVVRARSWNAKASAYPDFHDCAQFMAVLQGGAGVFADLSYLAPDKAGYNLPHYWRVLVHGTKGFAETYLRAINVNVVLDHQDIVEQRPVAPPMSRRYFSDFMNEVRGHKEACDLRTADCLLASRLAIQTQSRATG
ncbi:MAG: hypothetical protein QOE70_6505 [Chthoniobacter sp.]|jgi:predicted dehydrogenase|nr:hypothetical protein [Chthoniobacter sp.]